MQRRTCVWFVRNVQVGCPVLDIRTMYRVFYFAS
jgi:hypothetical protein